MNILESDKDILCSLLKKFSVLFIVELVLRQSKISEFHRVDVYKETFRSLSLSLSLSFSLHFSFTWELQRSRDPTARGYFRLVTHYSLKY